MKTVWSLVLVAGTILAAAAFQLAPDDVLSRRFIQTTTGTVKSYSAGEQIVIETADGTERTMKLDAGARVDDSLAEGETVTIAWLTDSLDRVRVTSIAVASAAAPEGGAGGSASSAPPSKAYASSTESGAMSATPSGPAASTPRPTVTGGAEYVMTPGRGFTTPARTMTPGTEATPGSSLGTTPGSPPLRSTPRRGTGSN
jgi:hypothetical protein